MDTKKHVLAHHLTRFDRLTEECQTIAILILREIVLCHGNLQVGRAHRGSGEIQVDRHLQVIARFRIVTERIGQLIGDEVEPADLVNAKLFP